MTQNDAPRRAGHFEGCITGGLRGAGDESSSEVLDWPLGAGLSREPLSQTPQPPRIGGLERPPPPRARKPFSALPLEPKPATGPVIGFLGTFAYPLPPDRMLCSPEARRATPQDSAQAECKPGPNLQFWGSDGGAHDATDRTDRFCEAVSVAATVRCGGNPGGA